MIKRSIASIAAVAALSTAFVAPAFAVEDNPGVTDPQNDGSDPADGKNTADKEQSSKDLNGLKDKAGSSKDAKDAMAPKADKMDSSKGMDGSSKDAKDAMAPKADKMDSSKDAKDKDSKDDKLSADDGKPTDLGTGLIAAGVIAAVLGLLAAALPMIKPMLPAQISALLPF